MYISKQKKLEKETARKRLTMFATRKMMKFDEYMNFCVNNIPQDEHYLHYIKLHTEPKIEYKPRIVKPKPKQKSKLEHNFNLENKKSSNTVYNFKIRTSTKVKPDKVIKTKYDSSDFNNIYDLLEENENEELNVIIIKVRHKERKIEEKFAGLTLEQAKGIACRYRF